MGRASFSPWFPTHSQSYSSKLETASSSSSVIHGHLPLLSSRESGEKAGLREGEEMPVLWGD